MVSEMRRRALLMGATALPFAVPLAPPAVAEDSVPPNGLWINVKDHGAVGDGKSDDTAAIQTAFASAGTSATIFFPPGTYTYNGPGLDSSASPAVIGAASTSTKIALGPDSFFINHSGYLTNLVVRDLTFEGGRGAIRHSYTGVNVAGQYLVHNCQFQNYTECAIATDAADMPYWRIRDCIFYAANTVNTIGVALSPGTDQCIIDSCSFIKNRIHIKARRGNNLHVSGCDFLQFSQENSGGPRVAVWVAPDSIAVNAGTGLAITECKFGNENLVRGDFRLLYADEKGGLSNGTVFPELAGDSTGFVAGHNIALNAFFGTGSNSHPVIYSTTPNVRSLHVHSNVIEGGQPSYVIEFRTPPTAPDRITSNSVFGPFLGGTATEGSPPFPASNAEGVGYWEDPQGLAQRANTLRTWTSGSSASYRPILAEGMPTFVAGPSAMSGATDAFGGADAVKATFSNASSGLYHPLAVPVVVGLPLWIEFDVADSGDQSAARQFFVWVGDGAQPFHWRRCVEVPSAEMGWVSYAFTYTPRAVDPSTARLTFGPTGPSEDGKSVYIGRPRVYQASERQLGGLRPAIASAAATEQEAILLVNDIRSKLIALGILSDSGG